MISIEHTNVSGFEAAIRGMRNPFNSWDKSDSYYDFPEHPDRFVVGENDLKLMKNLSQAGTDHSKYLRMIGVTADITAPLYWWKEYDTYKVGTVANSCSTMHTITNREFTLDDFSHEHLHSTMGESFEPMDALVMVVDMLNTQRDLYIAVKEDKTISDELLRQRLLKHHWWQIIQLLPSSYNQKRTVQLNYQVLKSMYHARKTHKLDEWRDFCSWCETLPYFVGVCA